MSQELTVILTRANWCPHCQYFEPIFKLAKESYKNNKDLKKYNIKFEDYDMADEDVKNTFMINHFNAMEKIIGYPTVLVNLKNKLDKKNEYHIIDHTIIDKNIEEKEQEKEASE